MLITVYACGTASTGDKIRAWITVLLLLTVMANSYRSMRRKERERQDKPRKQPLSRTAVRNSRFLRRTTMAAT